MARTTVFSPSIKGGIATKQQHLITPSSQKSLLIKLVERIPSIAHPGQIGCAREQTEGKEVKLPLRENSKPGIVSTQKALILLDKVEGGVPEGTHGRWISAKEFFGLPRLVKGVFERSAGAVIRQDEDGVWEEHETAMCDAWSEDLDKLEAAAAVWSEDTILTESERLSRMKDRDDSEGTKSNYTMVPFFSRWVHLFVEKWAWHWG